jgi:hypothetical protein
MDAIEHLPGCDLNHTQRQRCSSWAPPPPPLAHTVPPLQPYAEGTARLSAEHVVVTLAAIIIAAFLLVPVTAVGFILFIIIAEFLGFDPNIGS